MSKAFEGMGELLTEEQLCEGKGKKIVLRQCKAH